MEIFERHLEDLTLSTDRGLLDMDMLIQQLPKQPTSLDITPDRVLLSIHHSLCFGVYSGMRQVAFARIVTDFSTVGYLMDFLVFDPDHESNLRVLLLSSLLKHPELKLVRKWLTNHPMKTTEVQDAGFRNFRNTDGMVELLL